MKKTILVAGLGLLLLSLPAKAQFVVFDIQRIIIEFITNDLLMTKDMELQRQKLLKLFETLRKVKEIRARHTEWLAIHEDVEATLRSIREVENLSFRDIDRLLEKVASLSAGLHAADMPYLDEYVRYFSLAPGVSSANQLYEYLSKGTTAYDGLNGPAPSYSGHAGLLQEQAMKRYSIETELARRQIHTALAYGQLAAGLAEQAVDLSEKVNTDGSWRLSGIGDIFSDLFAEEAAPVQPALPNLLDMIRDWTGEIKKGLQKGGLFGGNQADKQSAQISDLVGEKMDSFDFFGLLDELTGGLGGLVVPPDYQAKIEKDGMRLSTGERIEVQGAALDNLMQSLDLQLAADELTLQALQPTQTQQRVDATRQHALIRKSLTKIEL